MASNITTILWVPGSLSVEMFADALMRAGFEEKVSASTQTRESMRDQIARSCEALGSAIHFPGLCLPSSGTEPGVMLRQVTAGSMAFSVVELDLRGRGDIPMPPDHGCNVESLAFEIAVARLFQQIGATYGYVDWNGNIKPLSDPALNQGDVQKGLAFELEALGRNRILRLHPINYFSDVFLGALPSLAALIPRFRAVRIGEYGWQLALTKCLIWGNPDFEEELAEAASIDSCWQFTRSLDTHTSSCEMASR